MTREEAFREINQTQDDYVEQLISLLTNKDYEMMKMISFTSATGTGKTNMMAKLINRLPQFYYIITTLSKGQLHLQVRDKLNELVNQDNFYVYGSADYKINSKLDAEDIISKIPPNTQCIWIRDEGHIRTNRWDGLLLKVCYKVINFSATNETSDIQCNFTSTMMLRTVNQACGTPEDAINKLLEIKKAHKNVPNYNPCAIFRVVSGNGSIYKMIVDLCRKHHLKYIDITEDEYVMKELCEDDNEYDVLINKFKIVEGIDIRRAHVLYMDNKPGNTATTIQVIGRCRRNALLYRKDIDIFSDKNLDLLKNTRECYVFYNVDKMHIDTDNDGELQTAFCNHISCQNLKVGAVISVINGQMPNGLYVIELTDKTGEFKIEADPNTGFNVVNPLTDFYKDVIQEYSGYYYFNSYKINGQNIRLLPRRTHITYTNWVTGELINAECEPYYELYSWSGGFIQKISLNELGIRTDNIDFDRINTYLQNKVQTILAKYTVDWFLENGNVIDKYNSPSTDTIEKMSTDDLLQSLETFLIIHSLGSHKLCKHIRSITDEDRRVQAVAQFLTATYAKQKGTNSYVIIPPDYSTLNEMVSYVPSISEKIQYLKFKFDFPRTQINVTEHFPDCSPCLSQTQYTSDIHITENAIINCIDDYIHDVTAWFENFSHKYATLHFIRTKLDEVISYLQCISISRDSLYILIDYHRLFEPITAEEKAMYLSSHNNPSHIKEHLLQNYLYTPYRQLYNDKESAIIGVDLMQNLSDVNTWVEAKAVSRKVGKYTKLNSFISNKYKDELEYAKSFYFNGNNKFRLDKKCNRVIGYCVEYYSKYLLYGETFISEFIPDVIKESSISEYWTKHLSDFTKQQQIRLIVRACMLMYRKQMIQAFGSTLAKIIPTISTTKLLQKEYDYFVDLVVTLGTQTANFIKNLVYHNTEPQNNTRPILSIKHITGLADYITEDTILDIKVTNNITEEYIRQVLAYHYLSTKRSDLHIRQVIVYDATSGKSVIVPITEKNQTNVFD